MGPASRLAAPFSRNAFGPLVALVVALPAVAIGDEPKEPRPEGRLFVSADWRRHGEMGGIGLIDPAEGTWVRLVEKGGMARLAPDGSTLAYFKFGETDDTLITDAGWWVVDYQDDKPARRLFDGIGLLFWSSDGKKLIVSPRGPNARRKGPAYTIDADGSNRVELPIPETETVEDWSPDGKWLLTTSTRRPPGEPDLPGNAWRPIYLMRPDGTGERLLVPADRDDLDAAASVSFPRFSPDGRRVVYCRNVPGKGSGVWVAEVDGSSKRHVLSLDYQEQQAFTACWSPDGKWLAVSLLEPNLDEGGVPDCHVEILRADGSGRRKIELPAFGALYLVGWRKPAK